MVTKKSNAAEALVVIVDALEALEDADRRWVLQSAASKWAIGLQQSANLGGLGGSSVIQPAPHVIPQNGGEADAAIARSDIRAFVRAKRPTTDVERVACLGYFLLKTTGQAGFTSQAINVAHVESGGSAINMPRALDNATRRSKYLSNRGAREKQLTTLGEDVVEALPNRDAVAAAEQAAKAPRARKKVKPGKKK